MTTADPVTRGEFSMLQSAVMENTRRIESMDTAGTRGVAVVQVQLTDLAKDVASLGTRMDQHEKEHDIDTRERRTARRWAVMAVIALMAAIEGPLLYLVQFHR